MKPRIPGWIYLEASMNEQLVRLLRITPGVIHSLQGVRSETIDISQWQDTLDLQGSSPPRVGSWVRVRSGPYKGDIGLVHDHDVLGTSGMVGIFVIPRLRISFNNDAPPRKKRKLASDHSQPSLDAPPRRKRKEALDRPMPSLFNLLTFPPDSKYQPVRRSEHCYVYRGQRLEHGLHLLDINTALLARDVQHMPSDTFTTFQASGHPDILRANFPRPSEWLFSDQESVSLVATEQIGKVRAQHPNGLEINLRDGAGLMMVAYTGVRKVISPGDFVEIQSGFLQERQGWVTGVVGTAVEVTEVVIESVRGDGVVHRSRTHKVSYFFFLLVVALSYR